ncbi:MAG: NAD(P)H-binding protein [Dehalococcoidia bacterium]
MSELNVVTGAFSFSGKYITRRLLSTGVHVRTLTGHPEGPNPFGDRVSVAPFDFDNPGRLVENLRGATTLFNTYWVRFSHRRTTFDEAVRNTMTLIRAAEQAAVRRLVHVSVTNPSETSKLPYFRGKALLERAVSESRLSYAIIRPTLIFGDEDILINNIAWLMRRLPVFAVAGSGEYRLQPIFVEDLAEIAVNAGRHGENVTVDAVGPDIFTFNELVRLIGSAVGSRASIVHVPPRLALFLSRVIGYMRRDVLLTHDEVEGLRSNLLVSERGPTGHTRLGDWLRDHASTVGTKYASELERHFR